MSSQSSPLPDPASQPLLENGLDFLDSAVGHLGGEPDPRELKYAVLHLASGIELVLKARLHEYDPAQLYQDPAEFDEADYAAGDFTGPKSKEVLKRLADADVELAPSRKAELLQLRKMRNRAEHFHLDDSVAAISAITARTLGFALDFIAGEFDAGALSPTASNQLEEIRAALPLLEHFVAHRLDSIADELATAQTAIVECPSCGQETSVLDDGATCLFCRAAATAEEGADNYAHLVLGESRYESAKQGISWVVSSCPECDAETLVDRGLSGDVEPADQWACFTCGNAWPEGSLGPCDRCGELISAGEGEMSICSDCFSALVANE